MDRRGKGSARRARTISNLAGPGSARPLPLAHSIALYRRDDSLEKIFRQGGSLKITFERFSIPREDFSITLIET